jgi:hypothetical protein
LAKETVIGRTTSGGVQAQSPVEFAQLFSFMVFVDSSDFKPEDLEGLYGTMPAEYLPNILYFVDKGMMLSMKFGDIGGAHPMEINLYPEVTDKIGLMGYKSKWCLHLFKDDDEEVGLGMAFFTFYYLLMSHLGSCSLRPLSLLPYYLLSSFDLGPRMHLYVFE